MSLKIEIIKITRKFFERVSYLGKKNCAQNYIAPVEK
jgi:hypothetical protein